MMLPEAIQCRMVMKIEPIAFLGRMLAAHVQFY